jgi:hypothetical protein
MIADLESTTSSVSSSGEKLWSLRRKRISVPVDNTDSTSKAFDMQARNEPLHQKRADMNDTSAKHVIERILYLLQRVARSQGSKRLGIVGAFQRANSLLESVHKLSSVQDQQGEDVIASTLLRDVLLVAESRLEALLSCVFQPLVSEDGQQDDLFTSDPWHACDEIATEDLLEFFVDSLESDLSKTTKTTVAKSAEVRTQRPSSVLADVEEMPFDGFLGTGVSDNSNKTYDGRGSSGTASTSSSRLSAVSSSSISIPSARSSLELINVNAPTSTKESVDPTYARGAGKLKEVIGIDD